MRLSCLPVAYFKQNISGKMKIEDWAREAVDIDLKMFGERIKK
jgi:hypothetical protein